MAAVRALRDQVTLRQRAAAEEILELFQRTAAEKRHLCCSGHHRRLTACVAPLGPEVHQLIPCEQHVWRTTLDPEPPHIKEDQEDPEPPHIKEDQEDPEPSHIKEDQEDPEPPHIKEDQEDPEPPHIKEDQEDPEPPHIKEDQEEFRCGREGDQLQGLEEEDANKFPFTAVFVKSDDEEGPAQSSRRPQRQTGPEADGDRGGPEPARRLRVLVEQQLTAAVEDIFRMFETTLAEYEREMEGLQKLLEGSVKIDEETNTSDNPQLLVKEEGLSEQHKWRISLDQEDPEFRHVKEEQEELWGEGEQLLGLEQGEEEKAQSSHLHQTQTDQQMKREAFEGCGGPEPHSSGQDNGNRDDFSQEMSPPHLALVPLTHKEGSVSCDGSNQVTQSVTSILNAGGKPFSCSVCAKGFNHKSDLKRHLRFHTGERPFSCVFCGKKFTEKADLKRHTRVHTGEKPFSCPICGKGFSEKTDLTRHVRVHTGEKPFSCSVCGKIFSQNENLRRHKRIHTGEKPFCCPACSKTFTHRGALVVHMRIHTGEKPFGCSLCGKRYSETGNLKKHMRVHVAEKPLGCGVCGKRFNYPSQVKNHKCSGESSVTTAQHS